MKSSWLLAGVVSFALLLVTVAIGTSNYPLEQTVFLERIAGKIEHLKIVPPETESAIRATVQSIRRNESRLDGRLQIRQQRAIARIEAALAPITTATIQPKDSKRPPIDIPTPRVSNLPLNQ